MGSSPLGRHGDGRREGQRSPGPASRPKTAEIPRFYFPGGHKPVPQEVKAEVMGRIDDFFDCRGGAPCQDHAALRPLVLEVLGLPSFFTLPLFKRVVASSAPGEGDAQQCTREAVKRFWEARLCGRDAASSAFECLRDDPARGGRHSISKHGLTDLVTCVAVTHPGLDFLVQTKEFQDRYVETCVYRILYLVNQSDNGLITRKELRRSDLVEVLFDLDQQEDVNLARNYFSYEHFYVIYCKFWELDQDHDFLIARDDLLRYGQHALTSCVVDRIFAECPRKFRCQVPGMMCYEDFVWFILSEEDKTTEPSLSYWFRCLDLACNGVLVAHELEHFYKEQAHRIACLNQEPVAFVDIMTQLTDMLSPELPGLITLRDLRRQPRQASNLLNVLFNLKKFFSFEMKDPRDKRGAEQTDWVRFATEEYARLAMEEELDEASGDGRDYVDESEILAQAVEPEEA